MFKAKIGNIARGAFLLLLAVMIVSWAITGGNIKPAESQPKSTTDRMYS